MTTPAIEFEHVSKRYTLRHQKTGYLKDRLTDGIRRLNPFATHDSRSTIEEFWALKDVSFCISQGESIGIVGANGSGKSTTLKILAGVTHQTSGDVRVHGNLGALIEVGAGFHPELTGRENVFLNGSILGMKKAEVRKKFDAIVEFAGVEQFIDTPVKHYSSGMYVRLGFSIAVHTEPDILLIDEVLAVGDLSFQRKCFDRMQEFKDSGRTFILISHSMSQIQTLCDRAILLNEGRLVADGNSTDVAELYNELQSNKSSLAGEKEQPKEVVQQPIQATQSDEVEQSKQSVKPSETPHAAVAITGARLLDKYGMAVANLAMGQPFVIEFDYKADQPVQDALAWLQLSRGAIRVLDSDTESMGFRLGTLYGNGTIRCEVPSLPIMPNTFDVTVGIVDGTAGAVSARHPRMLAFGRPKSLPELGCGWIPESDQRGLVYARPIWKLIPGLSPISTAAKDSSPESARQAEGTPT